MNLLCSGIADWCKKYGAVSDEDYPIILYGIQVSLNTSLKMMGIFLTGAIDTEGDIYQSHYKKYMF